MMTDELRRRIIESLERMTDEEHDAIMAEMVRDGIIDEEGNVLKRIPEPPDWLTQANGHPVSAESGKQIKPANKSKRSRKRS